jgi:uncharacterized RDD family membrane protein YckC
MNVSGMDLIPIAIKTPPLFRRMACWLYEGLLVFGVVFVAGCVFFGTGLLFGTNSLTRSLMEIHYVLQGFLFVIIGIYFVWLWAKGQTLAMKTWEITVLDLTGQPITQSRALLRYVLSWLWFLPSLALISAFKLSGVESSAIVLAWAAIWAFLSQLHPQKQFWHDALAGTQLATKPNVRR